MQPFKTWLAVVLMMLLANGVLSAETNLLVNPGLEEPDPNHPSLPLGYDRHIMKGSNAVGPYAWIEGGRTGRMGFRSRVDAEYGEIRVYLPKTVDRDGLYRFSCWYRTASAQPSSGLVSLTISSREFRYPTSVEWTPARMLMTGREIKGDYMAIGVWGMRSDRIAYTNNAQGKKRLQNGMAIDFYADDFDFRRLTEADYHGNLIENPGFEWGSVGHMAPGYRNIYNPGPCPGTIATNQVRSGKHSLAIECQKPDAAQPSTPWFQCNAMPIRPDDIATFRLWAKCSVPGGQMSLRVYTNGKQFQPEAGNWFIIKKKYGIGTEWTLIELTFMVPGSRDADYDPTTAWAQPIFCVEPAGACTVWVDDVEFVIETAKAINAGL